jgi:hypothetical protein
MVALQKYIETSIIFWKVSNNSLAFPDAGIKKKRTEEDLIQYPTDLYDVGLPAELQSQSNKARRSWRYCMRKTFNRFSQPLLGASSTEHLYFLDWKSDPPLGHIF